jgi:hypothetical protein
MRHGIYSRNVRWHEHIQADLSEFLCQPFSFGGFCDDREQKASNKAAFNSFWPAIFAFRLIKFKQLVTYG